MPWARPTKIDTRMSAMNPLSWNLVIMTRSSNTAMATMTRGMGLTHFPDGSVREEALIASGRRTFHGELVDDSAQFASLLGGQVTGRGERHTGVHPEHPQTFLEDHGERGLLDPGAQGSQPELQFQ